MERGRESRMEKVRWESRMEKVRWESRKEGDGESTQRMDD